jgi:alpha-L-fucosidase 2
MEGNQAIQGFTAGIVEMLLQSHAGEIELLPALPKAWEQGSIRGVRARGGYSLDLAWQQGRLALAELRAARAGVLRLRIAQSVTIQHAGRTVAAREIEPGLIEFSVAAGQAYVVTPKS